MKEKLDQMVEENILIPVTEPLVYSTLYGPRKLNKYVRHEVFQIPANKHFSMWDALSAFLQMPLDYETSLLKRYRLLIIYLPYRVSSAPEVLQKYKFELIDGLPGVIAYFDDMLLKSRYIFGTCDK